MDRGDKPRDDSTGLASATALVAGLRVRSARNPTAPVAAFQGVGLQAEPASSDMRSGSGDLTRPTYLLRTPSLLDVTAASHQDAVAGFNAHVLTTVKQPSPDRCEAFQWSELG